MKIISLLFRKSVFELGSKCSYEKLLLIFRKHAVLPVKFISLPEKVTSKNASKLYVKWCPW